jgi:hypothetical protein
MERAFVMGPQAVAAFVLLGISAIVLFMSYLIGTCRLFSLVAGMDESKVRDADGLARLFRWWLLSLGALEMLISLAVFVAPAHVALPIVVFAVLHVAGIVGLVIRSQRYLA